MHSMGFSKLFLSIKTNDDDDDDVHFGACLSYIQALKSCNSRSDCYIVIWGIPHCFSRT